MKYQYKYLLIIFLLAACKGNSQDKKQGSQVNENLTKINKMMVQSESKKIDEFIARHNFKTTMTGTGLRYEIYVHGKGEKPKEHSEVEIKYKAYLLDGTLCYTSDGAEPVKMKLGYDEQIRGLEEGIMLMVPGDKAHLVIPAHLGYGLAGDNAKIPPGRALYYDVELIKITE